MLQHRPFLVRGSVACLVALLGLLAVTRLSLGSATPIGATADAHRLATITPTTPVDLSPESGSFNSYPLVNLPGVHYGSVSWGDCNRDGVLDVLLTGQVSSTLSIAGVYQHNIDATFTQVTVLPGVSHGAAAWGDFDNDGWLDIVLTGDSAGGRITQLWRNDRNATTCTFSLVTSNLIGVDHSAVAWGDYDGDGQIDLLVAGNAGSGPVTKLYHNNHGVFTDSGLNLPGIQDGAAVWGDYDNDGRPDLLLTGSADGSAPSTHLYHNAGQGVLVDASAQLPDLSNSAAAWGDYDNDGYLDLLLEGTKGTDPLSPHIAEIYHNDHGSFNIVTPTVTLAGSFSWVGAAWGDYDSDGYLDALVSTYGFPAAYRNEITGSFAAPILIGPSPLNDGAFAWGNYNIVNRNLDVLVAGQDLMAATTRIYGYSNAASDAPPEKPVTLTTSIRGEDVILNWSSPASDGHTPVTGLSYNLRVGTQPDGIDIVTPMAKTVTGTRLLPALGNVYEAHTITLSHLAVGQRYYWSVQAIDTSFVGSAFADEANFQIPHRVFLPVILENFLAYYTNEWETEPNDTYLQANGPLISGRTYYGHHNDQKDYYSVYLQNGGSLNVDMTSPNGGTQIQLFYQVADVAHRVGFDPTPPYHIGLTGAPAGWYYIYVYTNPAYLAQTQVYTLTATYP